MSEFIVTDNLTPDIKGTSLALGFFDGIHIAHKKILQNTIALSKKFGTKSVVVTFKNHPMELLYNMNYEFITLPEERISIFKEMGFDGVIMADFTKNVSTMSAEEYFNNVLLNLEPKSISIGYNHRFGAKKLGDIALLSDKALKYGFYLDVTSKITPNDNTSISSTYIKNQLKSGLVEDINRLLYKPFSLKNTVSRGMQRGRWLGFPTANLEFPAKKIIPHFGVYAGLTKINDQEYPSIANVGMRPTFGDIERPLTEVNILGFNKNIYDETIEFKFLKMLREERKFSNPDALCEQILADKKQALAFLNKQNV